jgi:hypothetical protein
MYFDCGGFMKQPYSRELPKTHMCNPERVWVGSAHTDIRATFERIRQQQAQQQTPKKVRRIK